MSRLGNRLLAATLPLAALGLALVGGASGAEVDALTVRPLPAAMRYSVEVSPAEGQSSCEVGLTAELLRNRTRRAPRVVRRSVVTTDICATGEGGTTFVTIVERAWCQLAGCPPGATSCG